MFRCKVIQQFSLSNYEKIRNIKRKSVEKYGWLYKGDTFECDEEMARYLLGNNQKNVIVVKILEIKPESK